MTWTHTTAVHHLQAGSHVVVSPHQRPAVPAPLARWDFTEASAPFSTTAGDLPLTVRTGTPARVATPFGWGVSLDGASALQVAAANTGRLNIGGNGGTSVSVAAWVRETDSDVGFVAGCWQEDNGNPRRQYGLFYDLPTYGGDDRVCMHVSRLGGATPGYPFSRDYAASNQTITGSTWQLYVGTYDGQVATAYLNGVAEAYRNYTDPLGATYDKNPYSYPDGLNTAAVDFTVGACQLTGGLGNFATASFARLRVWDRALTPAQVRAMYLNEVAP